MCGIAGALVAGQAPPPLEPVRRMTEALRRRGPDHQARLTADAPGATAVLGHDRLSIVDLSPAGHQPMSDRSGALVLVFNGEIYNHVELRAELTARGHAFASRSDSEVILEAWRAWGPDALARFDGMFAFALFERGSGRLWLARDRFGVKPLCWAVHDGAFLFASTAGPLAREIGAGPNLAYVARGLRYWAYEDRDDATPYDGVRSVPPGHVLEVRPDARAPRVASRPFYDLETASAVLVERLAGLSAAEAAAEVARRLERAVTIRLRADVPLGVSLSGGLDSSSVAAQAAERDARVVGFCYGRPDAGASEGPLVDELARRLGIETHYVWPGRDEVLRSFWDTLEAQDAPFGGPSVMAQHLVYAEVRRHGVKVLLGGQGGDEAFMGYRKFQVFHLRDLLHRRAYREALGFGLGLVPLVATELPGAARRHAGARRRYREGMPTRVALGVEAPHEALSPTAGAELRLRQIDDVYRFSLATLLRYEDRNSMHHGIESRLPFMDHHLVELGVALPAALKLRDGYGKWVVREAVRGRIPESIRATRFKRGFDVSQDWIRMGLGAEIRRGLHERERGVRPFLPPDLDLDVAYSDARLRDDKQAFVEATSLLWLAQRA